MIDSYGLYHLYQEIKGLTTKFSKSYRRKFLEKTFEEIAQENFFKTERMSFGANQFVDLANQINSGNLKLGNWVFAVFGEFIKKQKLITIKSMTELTSIEKMIKFYTINETKKQFDLINTILAESNNVISILSKGKFDLYKVNEQQENKLYEMIRKGEVNFYFFVEAWEKGKFSIKEKKITNPEYKNFIYLMQIVRQNIKKR